MHVKDQVAEGLSKFLRHPSIKVLLIAAEEPSSIGQEVLRACRQHQSVPLYVDLSQRYDIQHMLSTLPLHDERILICDGSNARKRPENVYVNYRLHLWQVKIVMICNKNIFSGSTNPCLYFAPIINGRIQKHLIDQLLLATLTAPSLESLPKPALKQDVTKQQNSEESRIEQHFLNHILWTLNYPMLRKYAERVIYDESLKKDLLQLIYASRDNKNMQIAAANALSILALIKDALINLDLSSINAPYTNLIDGICDQTNFLRANLANAIAHRCWFREANLSFTNLNGIDFGTLPPITFERHVQSLNYSAEGRYLAIAAFKTVKIFDTETWKVEYEFTQFENYVKKVALGPDAQFLITHQMIGAVSIWSVKTKQQILVGIGGTECGMCFSCSEKGLIAIGINNIIYLYDSNSLELKDSVQLPSDKHVTIRDLAFNPSGNILVIVGASIVTVWNLDEDSFLWQYDKLLVHSVSFSPDGMQFATAGQGDGQGSKVHIWQTLTGEMFGLQGAEFGWAWTVAFHPSENILVAGGDDKVISIWDTQSWMCLTKISDTALVWVLAFNPSNPNQLASASCDDNVVHFWNFKESAANRIMSVPQLMPGQHSWGKGTSSIAFHPNGWLIASSKDLTLRMWHYFSGECLRLIKKFHAWNHTNSVGISPDGASIVSVGAGNNRLPGDAKNQTHPGRRICKGKLRIWNTKDWSHHRITYMKEENEILDCVGDVAFSPNGQWMVYFAIGKEIDADHIMKTGSVRFSDGYYILILNRATGESSNIGFVADPKYYLHECAHNIVYTLDGKWLIYISTHRIYFHSCDERQYPISNNITQPYLYIEDEVFKISLNNTRDMLICCAKEKIDEGNQQAKELKRTEQVNHIYLWEFSNIIEAERQVAAERKGGKEDSYTMHNCFAQMKPKIIKGHTKPVTTVVFSPYSSVFASGAKDGTVRIWHINKKTYGSLTIIKEVTCVKALSGFDGSIESISWQYKDNAYWLAIMDSSNKLYCFHISNDFATIRLKWKNGTNKLILNESRIDGAYMSPAVSTLFKQYGAIGNPLMIASSKDNVDPLVEIVKKYRIPDQSQRSLEKALRQAAHNNQVNDIAILVREVSNINAQDENPLRRKTALHLAVEKGFIDCVKLLLTAGVRTDIVDAQGNNAAFYAKSSGNSLAILRLMWDHSSSLTSAAPQRL
jgi:WD40 repeat protein